MVSLVFTAELVVSNPSSAPMLLDDGPAREEDGMLALLLVLGGGMPR